MHEKCVVAAAHFTNSDKEDSRVRVRATGKPLNSSRRIQGRAFHGATHPITCNDTASRPVTAVTAVDARRCIDNDVRSKRGEASLWISFIVSSNPFSVWITTTAFLAESLRESLQHGKRSAASRSLRLRDSLVGLTSKRGRRGRWTRGEEEKGGKMTRRLRWERAGVCLCMRGRDRYKGSFDLITTTNSISFLSRALVSRFPLRNQLRKQVWQDATGKLLMSRAGRREQNRVDR